MARKVHNRRTNPIIVQSLDDDGKLGHRPDVGLVVDGPDGPVPVAGTADGKIKVDGASGGGSGASATDLEAFDEGVTTFTPAGGVYDDTLTPLTAGQLAVERLTPGRAVHSSLRQEDGTELGVVGSPVIVGDGGASLTVDDGGSSLTVDGAVSITGTPTVNVSEPVSVDDDGGSLTVDDGGSTISVDDGDGSFTVDGTVGTTSADGAHATLGTTTDAEAAGDGTVVALLKRIRTKVGEIVTALAGTLTVSISGTPTVNVSEPVSVDDNGGSITVDGTVTVQDGGGSLTVDGSVSVSGAVDTELTTADLDTGAGTDTRAVVGLVLAASGGGALVGSANPMPVSDNGTTLSVDDGGGSLTIDNANLDVALSTLLTQSDFDTKIGSLTETAPATDTASSGLNGRLQRVAQRLTSILTALTGTLIVGDGGSTISVDDGGSSLTVDAVSLPLPTGAATEGTLGTLLTQSDYDTKAGSLTETAPVTDTASSGLNGRLQRIAQRLTTLIALVPAALTGSGNFKTAIQEAIAAGDNLIGRFKLTDGTTVASVRDLTNSNPQDVAIVDANGDQITSFGGGTQYSEGDTDTSITGTALMWEDEDDALAAASADKPLPVNLIGGADTAQFDGVETAYVHDVSNRRLLEELLEEVRDLKERMFAE